MISLPRRDLDQIAYYKYDNSNSPAHFIQHLVDDYALEYDYLPILFTKISLHRLAGSYLLSMDRGCKEENQHSLVISMHQFDANLSSSRS